MENNGLDVNGIVTDLGGDAAQTLVSTFTGVLPIVVPVFAIFWGVKLVLTKLKVNKASS